MNIKDEIKKHLQSNGCSVCLLAKIRCRHKKTKRYRMKGISQCLKK